MPEIPDSNDTPFNPAAATSRRAGGHEIERLVDWARRGFALSGPEAAKVVAYLDEQIAERDRAVVEKHRKYCWALRRVWGRQRRKSPR